MAAARRKILLLPVGVGRHPGNERLVSTPFSAQNEPESDSSRLRGMYRVHRCRRSNRRASALTYRRVRLAAGDCLVNARSGSAVGRECDFFEIAFGVVIAGSTERPEPNRQAQRSRRGGGGDGVKWR